MGTASIRLVSFSELLLTVEGWLASAYSQRLVCFCLQLKVGQLLLSKELISFSELMLYLSTKNRNKLLNKPLL
jgi:hypothetical protein